MRTRLSVEDRREQLLGLGLAAFSTRPYDEVAVDEIAKAAGISRGLLFHYFPSKRAFYLASLRRAADALLVEAFAVDSGPPLSRLRAGLAAYFVYVDRHGPAYSALLRGGVGSDGEVQALVEQTRAHIIERLRAELPGPRRKKSQPRLRAALRGWLGLVEAVALDWLDHRDLQPAELVELVIRPLAALVEVELAT